MTAAEKVFQELKKRIDNSVSKLTEDKPDYIIETPKEKEHGDFSTNIAMVLAKSLHRAPRDIAEEIIAGMEKGGILSGVEKAGAGFINFKLSPGWLYDAISDIEAQGKNYGRVDYGKNEKVMVEFISANPTGPMHMGNARGGAIGDCLAALLDRAGFDVTREFYVNDAGAQIDKFGRSLYARYVEVLTGACDFPEDGYQGEDIRVHAENFIEKNGDRLLSCDTEAAKQELINYALPLNLERMRSDLGKYRINYDVWFKESELYKSGEVEETVKVLKEKGLAYDKEDAVWFKSTEFGSEKDDVLVRTNGIPTYFAADIAYHRNKFIARGFDRVINIWGADHHGHIARMKGAMQAFEIAPERLTVVIMQLVRLVENGEVVRMSKRTGKMITLTDLIDDIGADAARFFFNLRQAGSHFDFDIALATEQSNENPVFYVQYAHARICSILRLLAADGITEKPISEINLSLLSEEIEEQLMKKLADLPEEIKISAERLEPSRITRYVQDVAALFHSFYNSCKVKCDNEELMYARIKLISSCRTVIGNCLDMLGVNAPEKM